MNNIYNMVRERLIDIFEAWEECTCDDDVMDLTKYQLVEMLEYEKEFKLYRYMPPTYFNIRNFETHKVHLSRNGIMNDVYEGLPCSFEDIKKSTVDNLGELAFLTCLTEEYNNRLMWSHYAQNHEGFCIEYDLMKEHDNFANIKEHLFPVIYTTKRQAARDYERLAESLYDLNKAINGEYEYDSVEPMDDIIPLFLTKDEIWKYEKEWRIIYSKKQMYDLDIRELNEGNINFNCITAIYLGYRINKEIKNNIIEICKRNEEKGSKINIFQENLTKDSYEFEYNKIF